jgi:hypothetical protein
MMVLPAGPVAGVKEVIIGWAKALPPLRRIINVKKIGYLRPM